MLAVGLFLPEKYVYQQSILTACTYSFCHANIFHLLSNCFAFIIAYNEKMFKRKTIFIIYSCAILAVLPFHQQICGFSAVIFAMFGINASLANKKYFLNCIVAIAVGFIIPNTAGTVHLVSFVLGYTIGWANRLYIDYKSCLRR